MFDHIKQRLPDYLIGTVLFLIGTVLFGALGFIGTVIWNMRDELSKQGEKISGVTRRIDTIANVLPDLRIRVATEILNFPYGSYVLASRPYQSLGKWKAKVLLIDSMGGARTEYETGIQGPNDQKLYWLINGSLSEAGMNVVSFSDMEKFSVDLKKPLFVSSSIEKQSSFAVRKNADEIKEKFAVVFPDGGLEIRSVAKYRQWKDVMEAIEDKKLAAQPETTQ